MVFLHSFKSLLLLLSLSLILLLSGCDGLDVSSLSNNTNNVSEDLGEDFLENDLNETVELVVNKYEGIRMEFIQGQPPTEDGPILDKGKSSFAVGVQLTNLGDHNVNGGDFLEVKLRGIIPEQFGVDIDDLTLGLDDSFLIGQKQSVSFDGLSYVLDARGDFPKRFQVDLCYDYSTQSHNGPVQVTDFEQFDMGENGTRVIFNVSNVGDGQIYKMGSSNLCDASLGNVDKNKVDFSVSLPETSNLQIDCSSSDNRDVFSVAEVRLWSGTPRTITCDILGGVGSDLIYEDLLEIKLKYMYSQFTAVTVMIKDTDN